MATTVITGVQYSGIWSLAGQANAKALGTWPGPPGAPTIGTATAGSESASITFTAPTNLGVPATITGYTATSSPGGITGTGTASPILVSGLSNGTAYTFTVTASNASGTGPASAASNSVTPSGNQLWTWGYNAAGALGLGNKTYYSSPKQVGSLTNWNIIYAGSQAYDRTNAIKTDGTLWVWGIGSSGQLGLGNTTSYSSPKQLGALTNWLSVASGFYFTVAINNGNLYAWGRNTQGQLGLNNTNNYQSPKQIGALSTWSKAVAGERFAIAIKTDGTLWSWGANNLGQLGIGNTTYYSSPKQIGALTNWSKITAGGNFCAVIKTDGTLWAWGGNANGQLGLGNTTYSFSSPQQVGALTNWSQISAGNRFCIAVKTDGTLWSWGSNGNGQLGLGNSTYYSSPKQIGALTAWSLISAAERSAMSIKTDGTLWSWGSGQYGQNGLNNTTTYSSPKQIGALTTWRSIAAGREQYAAIKGA